MVKIDAIRSKKNAKWLKRTRYGQNRRKKVKNRLEMIKIQVSHKSMNLKINVTSVII